MICYNNIICGTLSMKSRVKQIGARFRITDVRLRPLPSQVFPINLTVEIWGRNLAGLFHKTLNIQIVENGEGYHLELPVDHILLENGIRFIDRLYITAFVGTGTIIGCPWYSGTYSPQKIVLNLHDIILNPNMYSYSGTHQLFRHLEVDYNLDKIQHY